MASDALPPGLVSEEKYNQLADENSRLREQIEQLAARPTSLDEARRHLRAHMDDGIDCPVCGQMVKVYKRTINASMAKSLITIWKRVGWEYAYIPDVVGSRSREESKMRYWGLIEEAPSRRGDGGHSGWWRITSKGVQWVTGEITVPKFAYVYNGELLKLDGDTITFDDALGHHFDLRELMDR